MESIVENYSSFLELVLDVELPPYARDVVRAALNNAYATNNYAFLQYVNMSIASVPQIQSWPVENLNQWRAQIQPQVLMQLQNSYLYDPVSKVLLDLYNAKRFASSNQSSETYPRKRASKESDKGAYKELVAQAEASSYTIKGTWSKSRKGSTGGTIGSPGFIGGFFEHYESYEFRSDSTFRYTLYQKSLQFGESEIVETGHYKVIGNEIHLNGSRYGAKIFMFGIYNNGKSLRLQGLAENSIAIPGDFNREK